MTIPPKPTAKPKNPCFSSGPCAKRPGWSYDNLDTDILGRSHRAEVSKKKMKEIVDLSRSILGIPDDWKIGITPASDTGAIEMAMWNLMGPIGVDVFAWEAFSHMWLEDITTELRLPDVKTHTANFGALPDFSKMDPDRDAIFVWNGTTSGVCIPSPDVISKGDKGLRFCDSISAIFSYELPYDRLDVVTWSWQKLMGGEAAHGMIALSPKAIKRLEDYTPTWPMPKIFKLKHDGKIDWPFFDGVFINTPSMICVVEALDCLRWIQSIGGLPTMRKRTESNAAALDAWVQKTPWIDYLAQDPTTRSKISVCLNIIAPEFLALTKDQQKSVVDFMVKELEREDAAYDCKSYKTAPVGLRIWCGGTVETSDIQALTPWLDWAYATGMSKILA